ncbi:MAG TPA: hypothetical protein VIC85_02720 [Ktedonobacterales bacterium]|jgi:hypothetical protein
MRLDRVYSEGEALVALRKLGFEINDAPLRPGLYELSHRDVGGSRTVTVDQLCSFAEGASVLESMLKSAVVAQ